MAQVEFNPQISGMIGKVGRETYSKAQSGYVVKTTPYPSRNKRKAPSSGQIKYRGYFGQVQRSWIKCTQEQMAAWYDMAKKATFINKFGAKYPGDGYHLFLRLNQNRLIIGEGINYEPPTQPAGAQLNKITIEATPGSKGIVNIYYDHTQTTDDTTYIAYATKSQSAGVRYISNEWRNIAVITAEDADVTDITKQYVAVFGYAIELKKIFIKLQPIDIASGTPGMAITANTIVLDNPTTIDVSNQGLETYTIPVYWTKLISANFFNNALSQLAIENILVAIAAMGTICNVNLEGGTNDVYGDWTKEATDACANIIAKGGDVKYNK